MSESTMQRVLRKMREEAPEYVYTEDAEELLGPSGRMLSSSKRPPEGETVFWNACVFNEREQQVWHGDFNLTRDRDKLVELANRIGPLYLTREQPFRFKGLRVGRAQYPEAVVGIHPEETP